MQRDIERILIPHAKIALRVGELAKMITDDHGGSAARSGEITIIPILTGAMIFCADLIRHLPMRMQIGLLAVSSYPGRSIRSQGSSILAEQVGDLKGRHVLLVDDIIDSGGTLRTVLDMLSEAGAASLKTCVLLRKPTDGAKQTPVDYLGFDIPDAFVVGYGLDFNDHYRNLPDIVTLKPHVLQGMANA
ncbi:MAG TPA: hypoxanthine phosphoribosyltransferase [Tepidisphaeraceae bacterium]|nr:hypoxanthine phosphoribosyltransferase [Tepidisphaeraceae bacterium]